VAHALVIFHPGSRTGGGSQRGIASLSRLFRSISGLARIASDGNTEKYEAKGVNNRGMCHGILLGENIDLQD
jgi:hypothetical protein